MKLESIELTNFRNIRSLRLKADAGVNIIHGENAQGKTNLTEACLPEQKAFGAQRIRK